MKIINTNNSVKFSTLLKGQVFMYNDRAYIKAEKAIINDTVFNCINLGTGEHTQFMGDHEVELKPNATLLLNGIK